MAKKKTKKEEKIPAKKQNRILIEQKLEDAFSDLKSVVSKKKFERQIRKAGKLLNSSFSKKELENLRKQKEDGNPTNGMQDETTILIEELP